MVSEILQRQKQILFQLPCVKMELIILNEEGVVADTLTIPVSGLCGQILEENGIGLIALGYGRWCPWVGIITRIEAVYRSDLLGYFGIENARRRFLPGLLVFLSGQLEFFVAGFDTDEGGRFQESRNRYPFMTVFLRGERLPR